MSVRPVDRAWLKAALLLTLAFALAHVGWVLLDRRAAAPVWLSYPCTLGVLYSATLTVALASRGGSGHAPAWRWMALALGVFALADSAYDLLEWRGGPVPTPSVLDALYLAFYPLFSLGILALPRQSLRRAEAWRLTLDVGIMVGSLGALLWYGVLAAVLGQAEASMISKLVNLCYLVLSLCTLGLLLTVMWRDERIQLQQGLLALGLLVYIVGDWLYLLIDANGSFASGLPVELLWTGSAVLFALAAWSSRRAAPPGPPPGQALITVTRVAHQITRPLQALAPYLGLAACFVLSLLTRDEGTLAAHGALWGTAGVTLLVAARQLAALNDNAALTAQLAALNATLESRVAARTAEVEQGRAQLEAHARELAWQAHHDSLTGLPNRAGFLIALDDAVARQVQAAGAEQDAPPLAVLFLDLDGFKGVNDTLGHSMGDQLLIKVATRLRGALWPGEFTARLGGDEFMLLTPHSPQARAQDILELLAPPIDLGDCPVQISASVGVSIYPGSGTDAESLYMHADVAMYEAKRAGKGAARVFGEHSIQAAQSQAELSDGKLQDHLPGALERGEFTLHYQPICGAGQRITAFEALLRWDSPQLGRVRPGQFLGAAQEIGLDETLSGWVLNEACAQLARWHAAGHAGLRVAVNVSAGQFGREDFVTVVGAALLAHGLSGAALELEVTEQMLTGKRAAPARPVLEALRALGVSVSLAGFGADASALAPLLRLPLSTLKLDRRLMDGLGAGGGAAVGAQDQAFRAVRAVVALAHALGLDVVAEGVETRAQWQAVTELGCDRSQGFWLGHPQNAQNSTDLLDQTLNAALTDARARVR